MNARLATVLAPLLCACAVLVSCGDPREPPTTTHAVPKAAATVVSAGFSLEPIEHPGVDHHVTTIRLGDRIRLFAVVPDWTPATLAMLDREGRVLHSLRIDLPPGGTISGSLPAIDGWEAIRLTRGSGDFDSEHFERRIGVPESELTIGRMKEIGATHVRSDPDRGDGINITTTASTVAIASSETGLDPNFGRVVVIGGTRLKSYSMVGVGDEWKGEQPISDAHWLTDQVRRAIEEALNTAAE